MAWYVCLLSNLAPEAGHARWTVAVHEHPEQMVFVLNKFLPNPAQHCWALVYTLGPFADRQRADQFRSQHWLNGTRREERVLQKGVSLATAERPLTLTPGLAEDHCARLLARRGALQDGRSLERFRPLLPPVVEESSEAALLGQITLNDVRERALPQQVVNVFAMS